MGTVLRGPLEVLDHGVIMDAAEHLLLNQAELLTGGQLALAGEASKAGQVVGIAARPPHPVTGVDLAAAPSALGSKSAAGQKGTRTRTIKFRSGVFLLLYRSGHTLPGDSPGT